MKKITLKKIAVMMAIVSGILTLVLCIHIYIVTHPKGGDTGQRVMARIDFKQDIDAEDAAKITQWLYEQQGVDHVLCNAETNIAVFTYSSVKNDADLIVMDLKRATKYKAQRYLPDEKEMMAGCPVSAGSVTSKVYNFFKNI